MTSVTRTGITLRPSSRRVLIRAFQPNTEARFRNIVARVLSLPEDAVALQLESLLADFGERHPHASAFFAQRFDAVRQYLPTDILPGETRQLLIGAYFTQEYALEAAALFNPSMVWHPDQTGVVSGSKRFLMSLRATGEGHVSSIVFRSGVVDGDGAITMEPSSRFVIPPAFTPDSRYEKALYVRKAQELGLWNDYAIAALGTRLGDFFTIDDLRDALDQHARMDRGVARQNEHAARSLITLAMANYEVRYTPDIALSERVLFPTSPTESGGIEDARFVQFTETDGTTRYFATYTAYDGRVALPQLLETSDFLTFKVSTLNGPEVQNKGMALFPRRIDGHYVMISRQDNENIFLMFSDAIHFWYHKSVLLRPTFPWEFVQLGNCGSPIETDAGWLVLSHGVGPMRRYSIGAFLLDRDDPSKVLGRTAEPLLAPNETERDGYVPNVVYSCGAQIHNERLILPFAMSDSASSFATVPVADILSAMR